MPRRSLIDRIVLMPADGILQANLYGDLASLMNFAEAQEPRTNNAGSSEEPALLSVVAGTLNHLYRTTLIWHPRPRVEPRRESYPAIPCVG